jgi:hypothetical protein
MYRHKNRCEMEEKKEDRETEKVVASNAQTFG